MNLIEHIGYKGVTVIAIINIFALMNQCKYLVSFILFYYVQYFVVGMMKHIIKEPRPVGFLYKKYSDGGVYDGTSLYGMPSGHSSAVWYSTVYLWLVKRSPYLLILQLTICFNTMYQRWAFHKHSIEQLLAGALVGGSIAFIAVMVTKQAVR
jgi:membrane-associated phospholipid phosphatase